MAGIQDFFRYGKGEPVYGTYIYPYRILGEVTGSDPSDLLEVILTIPVDDYHILLTRLGGLCVVVPERFRIGASQEREMRGGSIAEVLAPRADFQEKITEGFNLVVCELALHGIASEPASRTCLGTGHRSEGKVMITGGGGENIARAAVPGMFLLTNPPIIQPSYVYATWLTRTHFEDVPAEELLRSLERLDGARALRSVSPSLPRIVASAYYMYANDHRAEAVLNSFLVIEQVINHYWQVKLSAAERSSGASTAQKAADLLRHGMIDATTEGYWTTARRHRNHVAHEAEVTRAMADEVMGALQYTLTDLCRKPARLFILSTSVYG